MAFLRAGFPIRFEPIPVAKRIGKSHIRPVRDGIRFMVIIFKIATLYSPLKIFLPISVLFFASGAGWYAYTFSTMGCGYRIPDRPDLRANNCAQLQQDLICGM
jgi:hypothetical protein